MSSDEIAYLEAKRRQKYAEHLIATSFTTEQRASYAEHCANIGMDGSPYDWPGWIDFGGFLDPRDGWSQ